MSSLALPLEPALLEVSTERRTSARSPLFMMVRDKRTSSSLWASDIGLGGMQCRSKTARFPGTYLDLSFRLPDTQDELQVGGQVLSLDEMTPGQLALGVRFCMVSSKAEREIYRFMDRRRSLWDQEAVVEAMVAEPSAAEKILSRERPFEALLLGAYADMRAREVRRLGFIRSLPTQDLPPLSQLFIK